MLLTVRVQLAGCERTGTRRAFSVSDRPAGAPGGALLKRLTEEQPKVLVQDWFKDSQTRLAVRDEVGAVLDTYLPDDSYDKALFTEKRDRVFELTLDLAINHRKWVA